MSKSRLFSYIEWNRRHIHMLPVIVFLVLFLFIGRTAQLYKSAMANIYSLDVAKLYFVKGYRGSLELTDCRNTLVEFSDYAYLQIEAKLFSCQASQVESLLGNTDLVSGDRKSVLWLVLSKKYLEEGNVDSMLASLKQGKLMNNEKDMIVLVDWAFSQGEKGQLETAKRLYYYASDNKYSLNPELFWKLEEVARLLYDRFGDDTLIKQQCSLSSIGLKNSSFDRLQILASLCRQVLDFSAAKRLTLQALMINPNSPWPFMHLAIIDIEQGEYAEAENYLEQIIGDYPKRSDAWALMGWLRWAQGQPQEAIQLEQKAIDLDPVASWPHSLLGGFLAGTGDKNGAEMAIRRAIVLSPEEVSYVVQLADLFVGEGRNEEALTLYHQALGMKGIASFTAHIQTQIKKLKS